MFQTDFEAKVFLWQGDSAWHFVALPKNLSDEIDIISFGLRRGFGSVPVQVTIGLTSWQTSIFPDRKRGSYILPLKKSVRKAESIQVGDQIKVSLIA